MAATSAPCSGPAPPKATSAKSRGSMPFCTVRERMALAMLAVDDGEDALGRVALGGRPSSRGQARRSRARAATSSSVMLAAEEVLARRAGPARDWRRSRSASCRRGRRRPGPARRRRSAARRGRRRPDRRRRCEPPPAPMVWMSIIGTSSGKPAIQVSRAVGLAEAAVDDDADIGAGAADVEGDELARGRRARRPRRRRARRRRGPTAA